MIRRFHCCPPTPSELAAINDGSVMVTERPAAAPVTPAGGGLEQVGPGEAFEIEPARLYCVHRIGQAGGQGVKLALNRWNLLVTRLERST